NDWVFFDERLNLMHCDDGVFLNFLCEMLHPIVRADATEVARLQQMFNEHLKHDNFELVEKTRISNRPVFIGRQVLLGKGSFEKSKADIINFVSEEFVTKQINQMESAIENSPDLAIGTAKELIETICRTILEQRN